MPWARVDDTAEGHRKFKRAGLEATGLYFLALGYCARYLTDGHVDDEWLQEKVPNRQRRQRLLTELLQHRLFEPNGDGYLVHDYLDYNPSRAELERRREQAAERKRRERMSRRDS